MLSLRSRDSFDTQPPPREPIPDVGGFTLIEVLIAALVLAVGLLGLAGLQALSLRMSDGSQTRTQASNLAYEIADALRANAAANLANYDGTVIPTVCNNGFARGGTNLITDDLNEWGNRLVCLLPGGQGDINVVNRKITVTVCWDETRQGATTADPICQAVRLNGTASFVIETEVPQ